MKQKNTLSVSIGTTALNEEQNIKRFLDSVCAQAQDSISIKEIIVISDGSTDETVDIVKGYKDSRIKLFVKKKRLGKPSRVNELLRQFTGDVLVFFDADVVLDGPKVVERLTRKFRSNEKLGLVGGNPQPLPSQTFIEGAINDYINARDSLRETFDFKKSGHAIRGPVMAFSRRFAKQLTLPSDILGDDGYSYLKCKTSGFEFHHEQSAIVWYRSPQTIKDYINQATRFLAGVPQLYKYFDREVIDQSYRVPASTQRKIVRIQMLKNPLGYAFLKILHLYCSWRKKSFLEHLNIKWVSAKSSKGLFTNKI